MKASSGWAADVIAAGRAHGVVPSYGGADWQRLDESDPRRLASLVIAAECWWHQGTPDALTEALEDSLAELDAEARYRLRALSWDMSAAQDWAAVSRRPWHSELERRRSA